MSGVSGGRRRRSRRAPLPQQDGVDAVRVRLPDEGSWASLGDHLVERFAPDDPERVRRLLAAGDVVDDDGRVLPPDAPYLPGAAVWFHRDLPAEVLVPFGVDVVHRDERLLVADKPHFLATTPGGRHVAQTALVQLRRRFDLPDLAPAHRLDRLTAGLVMFTVDRRARGAYQQLFDRRLVDKRYLAVAPFVDSLSLPRTVRNRIVKRSGVLRAEVVHGMANAETRIELVSRGRRLGLYRLVPRTGRTHQLRVHMAGLGMPIVGDDLYPRLELRPDGDFARPLQLLADRVAFVDPFSGQPRRFRSRRTLALAGWARPRRPY